MTVTTAHVAGIGLITGQPVEVTLAPLPAGSGIHFDVGGTLIPAKRDYVVNTNRGVTLGCEGKTLSIVEHFLAACAMTGHMDLRVRVMGAPELPLMDGSAQPWVELLRTRLGFPTPTPYTLKLQETCPFQDPKDAHVLVLAIPAERLQISYMVDFDHSDLRRRWFSWSANQGSLVEMIAPARTFGFTAELPALQARGLALGVTPENTLGLFPEGGYTTPLRFPNEPIRHKILDLIGDLMLCGIPITRLQAHIIVFWGGHTAHLAFGQRLAQMLSR